MQKLIEVIELVASKYLDEVQLILNKDMLILEYMYIIGNELDVYKTIEVREFNGKLSIKIYQDKITKVITVEELEDIFEICHKNSIKRKHSNAEIKIIKDTYSIGSKIRLRKMYNFQAPPPNTIGTVTNINDIGQIQITLEDGNISVLNVGVDDFEIIENKLEEN